MLKIGTTFSGIGAPEQALKNLKIPHVVKWACDNDKNCKKTYFANHTCEVWYDDITTIDINGLEYVDLYVFGFPCQDISTAGYQDLNIGRTILVENSLNIIDKIKPRYIIFENVKTLLSQKFSNFFEHIINSLTKNYKVNYSILNSRDFNIPQNRHRVFGVGVGKDIGFNFVFPKPTELKIKLKDLLDESIDPYFYKICPSMIKAIEDKKCKILNIEEWSCCLTTKQARWNNGGFIKDKGGLRYLTTNECRKLQGFPDSFVFPESNHIAYHQFGNTITVPILESIYKNLLDV